VILCEEERKAQAKGKNENVWILPNIPNDVNKFDEETLTKTQEQKLSYKYVVSYVGVFDKDRGLENLLEVISRRPDILLNIAGFGVLGALVQEYASKFDNICHWGRVDYSVGQSIMKNSDMIAAMYHLTSPLHKYAAPNKYYESLYLGVPMITTENTLVGSKVKKYNTGFVIAEARDSLEAVFDSEALEKELIEKKENCSHTWENVYVSYYEDFMREKYLKVIE
jgi:glycosyltransferase involved in cell wall biosynthesis